MNFRKANSIDKAFCFPTWVIISPSIAFPPSSTLSPSFSYYKIHWLSFFLMSLPSPWSFSFSCFYLFRIPLFLLVHILHFPPPPHTYSSIPAPIPSTSPPPSFLSMSFIIFLLPFFRYSLSNPISVYFSCYVSFYVYLLSGFHIQREPATISLLQVHEHYRGWGRDKYSIKPYLFTAPPQS